MKKYNTLKNKKDFELFISKIPDYIESIKEILNKSELLYNEEEACDVSNYFKNNNEAINNEMLKSFIAYFGESIIKRYGGEWFFTGAKDAFSPNEAAIGNSNAIILRNCPIDFLYEILETKNINGFNENLEYNIKNNQEIDVLFSNLFPKKKKR